MIDVQQHVAGDVVTGQIVRTKQLVRLVRVVVGNRGRIVVFDRANHKAGTRPLALIDVDVEASVCATFKVEIAVTVKIAKVEIVAV